MNRLIGRTAEIARLDAALAQAAAGTASVIVLDGDAGVGKTRVMSELVQRARGAGALALIGHCVDLGDVPPPYLPFTEAFARLAAQEPDLVELLRVAYPPVARLLPRGTQGAPGADIDRVDRGELFEAVAGALGTMASGRTVVLFVEDVHWADQATRDLLGFLFTRLRDEPVAILVSYRSDDLHRRHPLRPTLAQWSRLPAVERVHLAPLPPADVRALVREMHPGPVPESELGNIVSRADGNAFFAEELVAASEQYGDARQLPWQLADVLLVRLDRLGADARDVVRVAAVGGRRVNHELLSTVAGLGPHELDVALREAVDANILEPTPSGRGYTFRHALLAEAVYDDLLPGERVRIHAAYAAALAERGGNSAELARHARASHDVPTAYRASRCAGEEAMGVAAPREAMQHFQSALEMVPQLPEPPADTSDLVLSVVDAAVAAGWPYRALRLARQAVAELPADAPDASRARLMYALGVASVAGEADNELLSITAEALRLAPADPPTPFRAGIAALHARVCMIFGRDVEASRWARTAVEVAAALGRPALAADAETTLAMLQRRADEPAAVAERLVAAAEGAEAAGDRAAELRSRYNLGSLYYELGELDRSQAAYELTWERARAVGRPWTVFGADSRVMVGLIQYVSGDWDGALRTLDISGESVPAQVEAMIAATSLFPRFGRGEGDKAELLDMLRSRWERDSRMALFTVQAMLEYYEQHALADEALALADEGIALLGRLWQETWFLARIRLSAQQLAVLSAAAAAQPHAARAALCERGRPLLADARTAAERGLPAGRRLGPEGEAWAARLEAEWARLRWLADLEPPGHAEHVALWQAAVAGFGYGNVYEQARSRARLAAVLRAGGDGREAAVQAELARTAARALGATPLLAEIRLLGTTASRNADAGPGALTDREREVLGLLVEGCTNREIARRLYISEKTVSVHVSNILGKLGARSRTEAAAIARRDAALLG
jgi:DNA-binding NarL/FixJ family response regulator